MKPLKKSRFLYVLPEANSGKILELEALQAEYSSYLKVCIDLMLTQHCFKMPRGAKQEFFPECERLSSQIVKNVRDHAISMVSGWAASKYATKLKGLIRSKFKAGEITEGQRAALSIIGKCLANEVGKNVDQESLDLYWQWLLDEKVVGRAPQVSSRVGMKLSEMTARLETSEDTKLTSWWLGFSHLQSGKRRIQLPLAPSPYIKKTEDASKGILARKTKQGRWRFEVVDKRPWVIPQLPEDSPKVGVDVGLNVMAATSDGLLLGSELKPKFNALYTKVKEVRANRQRQDLKDNSSRLDRLEARLTGLVKTCAGEAANKLVEAYPGFVFIIEDLDLRGCKGQKRFAYRALHHNLGPKAQCFKVNPAYSSQPCPSCGYVSRLNRKGTKFICRCCGKIAHADWVGGIGLLRRSEDKQIGLDDSPSEVRVLLRERFRFRRTSSSGRLEKVPALKPISRRLTVRVSSKEEPRIASNLIQAHDQL